MLRSYGCERERGARRRNACPPRARPVLSCAHITVLPSACYAGYNWVYRCLNKESKHSRIANDIWCILGTLVYVNILESKSTAFSWLCLANWWYVIQNSRSTDNWGPGRVFARSEIWAKCSRDSGNVKGIRDLTAAREARFAKTWARMQDWQKKDLFGIAMEEVRNAGFLSKRSCHAG